MTAHPPIDFETIFRYAPVGMCISVDRVIQSSNDTLGELFWCHVSGRALDPQQPLGAGVWTFEDVSEKRPVSKELTPREREIAAFIVEGKTSKMIAKDTGLSPRTVEMHRAKLMRKFNASTSSELVHKLMGA